MNPAGQAFGTGPSPISPPQWPDCRPEGDGTGERLWQAIGIEKVGQLQVQADSTPAWLGHSINTSGHLLRRAVIAPWAEIPAA